jgi:hypothetical protein
MCVHVCVCVLGLIKCKVFGMHGGYLHYVCACVRVCWD